MEDNVKSTYGTSFYFNLLQKKNAYKLECRDDYLKIVFFFLSHLLLKIQLNILFSKIKFFRWDGHIVQYDIRIGSISSSSK